MEMDLGGFTASNLRGLLIKEIKLFIMCLGFCAVEDLEEMRWHIRRLYEVLGEKEKCEMNATNWEKDSSQFGKDTPQVK